MDEHDPRNPPVAGMPPDAATSTDLTQFTITMGSIAEVLKVASDAATGYRQHLIDSGWAEPTAQYLAGQALATWQHRWLAGAQ